MEKAIIKYGHVRRQQIRPSLFINHCSTEVLRICKLHVIVIKLNTKFQYFKTLIYLIIYKHILKLTKIIE